MTDRPQRNPLVPLVSPSAALPEDLAENFRRIYAGALADHRSLEAGGGVYAVRCLAPLVVTEEGLAFNWHDPIVFQVMRDMMGDAGLVKVDAGDEADFLINQIVSWDGEQFAVPAGHASVSLVQPGGPHTPLMGLVAMGVGGDGNPAHSGDTNSVELRIHYKGADNVSQVVSTLDWRPLLVRVFARASDTLEGLRQFKLPPAGSTDSLAGLWPSHWDWGLGASPYQVVGELNTISGGAVITFRCRVDAATGRLLLEIDNDHAAPLRGAWEADPAPAYAGGQVVLGSDGSYYQYGGPNNTDPTLNLGDWGAYTMPEAWYHARLDVMGQAPASASEYVGKGNAS